MLGGGYDLKHRGLTFGPTAPIQYNFLGVNAFTETGSLAPLHVQVKDSNSLRTQLGVRSAYEYMLNGVKLRPEVRVAWEHESMDSVHAINSQFASGAGTVFTVDSPKLGRGSLALTGGWSAEWPSRFSIRIYYDGQLARDNCIAHSINGGVSMSF